MKYLPAAFAALVILVAALWEYSFNRDMENFAVAKNRCEIGCVQDSGGISQCRAFCKDHPDHYP
jgi:hypothetical protein